MTLPSARPATPHAPGALARAARRPWIRLLVLGLLLGFAFQGTRGLWSTDEGRYVDGALQMLDSGNYLIPAYSPDRSNLSKPPVTYWVIAGAIAAFGHGTWAIRAPYALAFMLTLLALYAMGERLLPERPWLPGLIYGCAALPFFAANIVSTDGLLTLFEAVAALGFVRWSFGERERTGHPGDAVVMWLGLGLAFLTKGPPGLILLLAVLPFVIARHGWRGLGRVFAPAGVGVFLVVGVLWYALVTLRDPQALHYFLHGEVYERLFTGAQDRHPGAWGWLVVYLPTLAVGSLPWWPLLLRNLRDGVPPARSLKPWLRRHPAGSFLLLWLLVPLVVFCLAQSRLPLYILPLFLPLSLLLASGLGRAVDLRKPSQRILLGVWVVVLLVLKGGVAHFVHPAADERLAARQLLSMTQARSYGAVVFVEATAADYAVEEATPWGLRLYMQKPVYGIAWSGPGSTRLLCRAVHDRGSALVLLDASTTGVAVDAVAAHCPVRAIVPLGTWRHRALKLFEG